jgi:hypothetical protein
MFPVSLDCPLCFDFHTSVSCVPDVSSVSTVISNSSIFMTGTSCRYKGGIGKLILPPKKKI